MAGMRKTGWQLGEHEYSKYEGERIDSNQQRNKEGEHEYIQNQPRPEASSSWSRIDSNKKTKTRTDKERMVSMGKPE